MDEIRTHRADYEEVQPQYEEVRHSLDMNYKGSSVLTDGSVMAFIDRCASLEVQPPPTTAEDVPLVRVKQEVTSIQQQVTASAVPVDTTSTNVITSFNAMQMTNNTITTTNTTDKPQLKTLMSILMAEHKEWFSNKFCGTFITPGSNPTHLDKYAATVRIYIDPAWNVHNMAYPEYSSYMHIDTKGGVYLEMTLRMGCIGLAAVPATVCGATGFNVERKAPTEDKPKPDDNTMLVSTSICLYLM
jgi:hypothetical protein